MVEKYQVIRVIIYAGTGDGGMGLSEWSVRGKGEGGVKKRGRRKKNGAMGRRVAEGGT